MQLTYKEKIIFTKEEVAILKNACDLLDNIYKSARGDGDIEVLASTAMENIYDLLSDEYSDME